MTYGTIKVDTVTFTDAGIDKSVTLSGLVQNPTFSGNVTVTGTLSGVTVTGTTANFTSGNFTNISGGTHTITSGVFAAGSAASPSITFTGDLNTGIYSPGADQVAISTGGSGRLFVDSSGNVGVNTTPSSLGSSVTTLEIKGGSTTRTGGLRVSSSDSSAKGAFYIYDGAGVLGTETSHPLGFYIANSERMRLDTSGRLGLGTSSPGATLHVSGSGNLVRLGDGTNTFDVRFQGPNNWDLQLDTSADKFNIRRNSSSLVTVDGAGRLGIGTTSVSFGAIDHGVHIYGSGAQEGIRLETTNGSGGILEIYAENGGNTLDTRGSGYIRFNNAATEWGRWDSSGRFLVGTSSARSNFLNSSTFSSLLQVEGSGGSSQRGVLSVTNNSASDDPPWIFINKSRGSGIGSNTLVANNEYLGVLAFQGNDGAEFVLAGQISCEVDGTPGANDMPGRLVFSTTADGASSPTEQLRIDSAGTTIIGGGAAENNGSITIYKNNSNGGAQAVWNRASTTAGTTALNFKNGGTQVGTVVYNNSSTAYNTSSDYRLKENVTAVTDGITRLQQLKPSRFNFIADPTKTVDGFLAHEVQTIVPEAITGEKDAVDDEGNPQYQGIDQSKLVPLLTAALQEAIAKIKSLEARLTAAGI